MLRKLSQQLQALTSERAGRGGLGSPGVSGGASSTPPPEAFVEVLKEGAQQGHFGRVLDSLWNGMVKVRLRSNGSLTAL
jgi:hypothetical protein